MIKILLMFIVGFIGACILSSITFQKFYQKKATMTASSGAKKDNDTITLTPQNSRLDEVNLPLEKNVISNALDKWDDRSDWSAAHEAIKIGDIATLYALLKKEVSAKVVGFEDKLF